MYVFSARGREGRWPIGGHMGKGVYYGEGEIVEENILHRTEVIFVFSFSGVWVSNSGGVVPWLVDGGVGEKFLGGEGGAEYDS
jgi:hypothetical protein